MKRKRRQTPPGDFQDPLSNYDEPEFDDQLERSLMQDVISEVMIYKPYKTVNVDVTVEQSLKIMSELGIACLMVTDGDKLVGVFSERDVINRIAGDYPTLRDRPVREFMTQDPIVVHETDCPAKAINQMAVGGFRHIPVLSVDERIAGILGPRRVVKYVENFLHD